MLRKQAVREAATIYHTPCKLTIDLLTLRVTWVTSMPILVFLGLSVLDLGLMYSDVQLLGLISFEVTWKRICLSDIASRLAH